MSFGAGPAAAEIAFPREGLFDVYRKAWTDAGHPGEAPVYLRCPGFVAKTDSAAQEAYGATLMQHFRCKR